MSQVQRVVFSWGKQCGVNADRTVYAGFSLNGVDYAVGDCVFLYPESGAQHWVARIVSAYADNTQPENPACFEVRWFQRVASAEGAEREVVELEETAVNPIGCISGKCTVLRAKSLEEAGRAARGLKGSWFFCRAAADLAAPQQHDAAALQPRRVSKRTSVTAEDVADSEEVCKRARTHEAANDVNALDGAASPGSSEELAAATLRPSKAQHGVRMCVECGATQTPQWREGPQGPKTLCNACGVRYVRAQQRANKRAIAQGVQRPVQVPVPPPKLPAAAKSPSAAPTAGAKVPKAASPTLGRAPRTAGATSTAVAVGSTAAVGAANQRPMRKAAIAAAANRTAELSQWGAGAAVLAPRPARGGQRGGNAQQQHSNPSSQSDDEEPQQEAAPLDRRQVRQPRRDGSQPATGGGSAAATSPSREMSYSSDTSVDGSRAAGATGASACLIMSSPKGPRMGRAAAQALADGVASPPPHAGAGTANARGAAAQGTAVCMASGILDCELPDTDTDASAGVDAAGGGCSLAAADAADGQLSLLSASGGGGVMERNMSSAGAAGMGLAMLPGDSPVAPMAAPMDAFDADVESAALGGGATTAVTISAGDDDDDLVRHFTSDGLGCCHDDAVDNDFFSLSGGLEGPMGGMKDTLRDVMGDGVEPLQEGDQMAVDADSLVVRQYGCSGAGDGSRFSARSSLLHLRHQDARPPSSLYGTMYDDGGATASSLYGIQRPATPPFTMVRCGGSSAAAEGAFAAAAPAAGGAMEPDQALLLPAGGSSRAGYGAAPAAGGAGCFDDSPFDPAGGAGMDGRGLGFGLGVFGDGMGMLDDGSSGLLLGCSDAAGLLLALDAAELITVHS